MKKRGGPLGPRRGDRTSFPYEASVVAGKLLMPADVQRLHRFVLDTASIKSISDEMRAAVEALWPELTYKLPPADGEIRSTCRPRKSGYRLPNHEDDSGMKKSKRKSATKRARQAASGRAGGPTAKRLKHVADGVLAQERQDRRSLDRQAERAARKKRKPE